MDTNSFVHMAEFIADYTVSDAFISAFNYRLSVCSEVCDSYRN